MNPFLETQGNMEDESAVLAQRRSDFRRRAKRALVFFASSFGLFAMTLALGFVDQRPSYLSAVGPTGFAASAVMALVAIGLGVFAFAKILVRPAPVRLAVFVAIGPILGGAFMALAGLIYSLFAIAGGRGRQLRRLGTILLPPVKRGPGWSHLTLPVAGLPNVPRGLADQWRDNGRTEHASVAAFARLTLDLMALGAPSRLVAAAQRDAIDEIRHAELCFSLARELDGDAQSPSSFREAQRAPRLPRNRTRALAYLAVDSLIDGVFHEGLSARVIAKLAKRCEVPAIRDVLMELAADEGRHAANAWEVVKWCVAEGGIPVMNALQGAMVGLPICAAVSHRPEAALSGEWEAFGIPSAALEAQEFMNARSDVLRRSTRIRVQMTS